MNSFILVIFSSIFLYTSVLEGQENRIITQDNVVLGTMFDEENKAIKGRKITFQESIYKLYVDSLENRSTISLRKTTKNGKRYKFKGSILFYDFIKQRKIWDYPLDYSRSTISYYDQLLVKHKPNKSIGIDLTNGKEMWEVNNLIAYTFPLVNTAIGYKTKAGLKKRFLTVEGIDMTSGDIAWERNIDRTYGWRELIPLSDTMVLINASGIHFVNLKTGEGRSHEEKVGKEKYNFWYGANTLYNINSDVILDTNYIYNATSNALSKFDHQGNLVWLQQLDSEQTSKSFLHFDKDDIIIINLGLVNSSAKGQMAYGSPYIARFTRSDGSMIYKTDIPVEKDFISRFSFRGDVLFLMLKDEILSFDFSRGKIINRILPKEKIKVNFENFVTPYLYLEKSNDQYFQVSNVDTSLTYFLTKDETIYGLDSTLSPKKVYKAENIFLLNKKTNNGNALILGKEDSFIINSEGKPICKLNITYNTFFTKNYLFSYYKNVLKVIDRKILSRYIDE